MGRIKWGMPTLIELGDLAENERLCADLGLDFIEIGMFLRPFSSDRLMEIDLGKRGAGGRIGYTVHLPEELDLGAFNGEIREASVRMLKNLLERADADRIGLLNMHLNSGTYISLPDRKVYVYEEYFDEYRMNVIRSFDDISGLLKQRGIRLCIENTGTFGGAYPQRLLSELLRQDDIGLTWDTGHDASAGYSETGFMLKNAGKIFHIHLHDYRGKDHQELYTGEIDIDRMVGFAADRGASVVIETKDVKSLTNSVRKLRERKLLD